MDTFQRFDTADVLVLEVEREPEAGELVNLVENPTGNTEFGLSGYGWISPVAGTIAGWNNPPGETGQWLALDCLPDQANYFWTEPSAITPTDWVSASYRSTPDDVGNVWSRARIQFLDYDQEVITSSPVTAWQAPGTITVDPVEAPADAYYVRLAINAARNVDGDQLAALRTLYVTDVRMASDPDPDVIAVPLPDMPSHYYDDLITLATSISINRAPLDVGTMTVQLLADALSPDQLTGYGAGPYGLTYYGGGVQFDGTSLRPGKNVRLNVLLNEIGSERRIYTGEVLSGRVDYDMTQPEGKRAKITLNCVDAAQRLAAKKYRWAYSAVSDVRSYMEGLGVPWDVLSVTSTDPAAAHTVDADGTVLDQLTRTRDTNAPLLAWIDNRGWLKVRNAAGYLGSAPGYPALSERHYNGNLVVNYDTATVVNSVKVTLLHGTGSTDFGPYERPRSIVRWGRRTATYTAINTDEWDSVEARAYAGTLLNANAEPSLRVESATVPILSRDVSFYDPGSIWWAGLDLYDPITVTNDNPAFSFDLQVTSIQHSITPEKWLTTYGFGLTYRAALPTVPIR